MLDKFMQELKGELKVEEKFATEVPGVYNFPVDENLYVTITEIPHGLKMTCTFSECSEKEQEEFFTQTLIANLFGQGTEGAVLGLDAEAKRLHLSREIDYNIEYQEFRDILEDFLNSVEFWKEEAKAYGTKIE